MKNKEIKSMTRKINVKNNPFGKRYIRNMMFVSVIILTLLIFFYGFIIPFVNQEIIKYRDAVLPNTYINGMLLENHKISSIESYFDEIVQSFNNEIIYLTNINDTLAYKISDMDIHFNNNEIIASLKSNLSFSNQVKRFLGNNPKREYELEILKDNNFYRFIEIIKKEFNVSKVNGTFIRGRDYNIKFDGYKYGFSLNEEEFINELSKLVYNKETILEIPGEIENFDNYKLATINKKVAEYKTNYSGDETRKKNIELAAKKLNGTIINPNQVFSYYKEVGPYNAQNGYFFYYNLVGSGVCQVSTTMYNTALLSGLPIVSRSAHGKKVWYVPGGLDATVFGNTVDFKFRNNYEYPLYINSYTLNNYVYISIWSNEKVNANKSYKLRSVKIAPLAFKVYRDIYEKNKLVKTELVNTTYYYDSY